MHLWTVCGTSYTTAHGAPSIINQFCTRLYFIIWSFFNYYIESYADAMKEKVEFADCKFKTETMGCLFEFQDVFSKIQIGK